MESSDSCRAAIASVIDQIELLYSYQHATSPLAPDLVGEHLVATIVDSDLIDGCCRWIASQPIDARSTLLRQLLTVLQRAASKEHGRHARQQVDVALDHIIATYGVQYAMDIFVVAAETEGPLVERLELSLRSLDKQILATFDKNVPEQSLVLVDFSLHIAEKIVELARSDLENSSKLNNVTDQKIALFRLGESLITLGNRLHDIGDRYRSMEAIGEASAIFLHLRGQFDQNASVPLLFALALALTNASVLLSKLDATHDLMWSGDMGTQILADLNSVDNKYLPYLARALVNLGIRYAEVGSYNYATSLTIQSLKAYACLLREHPTGYRAGFARALSKFATRLAEKRRFVSALRASQCALELYTEIAGEKPDAFLPGWADCLDNHANRLGDTGRWPEAHKAAIQSVELYRRLAVRRPSAYAPDLARSYRTLARTCSGHKDYVSAAAEVLKGIEVLLPLLENLPQAFRKQATELRADLCAYSEMGSLVLDGEALRRLDQAIAKLRLPN